MKALDIFLENQLSETRIKALLQEANIARKLLADPKRTKMMAIAISHDWSFPKHEVARLGDKAEQKAVVELWGRLIDNALAHNPDGDLSRDGTFDDWLVGLYINGHATYEEIVGETGDALGLWKRLSTMVKREPNRPDPENPNRTIFGNALVDANGNNIPVLSDKDRNLSSFKTLHAFRNRITSNPEYRGVINELKKQRKQEKMQADPVELVILDDEDLYAVAMFNYGATYKFARGMGDVLGEYCTGFPTESGVNYAEDYLSRGLIVGMIFKNFDRHDKNRKFQMLAADKQLRNAPQSPSNQHESDRVFATQHPGAMKRVIAAIQANADQIKELSGSLQPGGYNIAGEISEIQQNFPLSASSDAPAPAAAPEQPPAA